MATRTAAQELAQALVLVLGVVVAARLWWVSSDNGQPPAASAPPVARTADNEESARLAAQLLAVCPSGAAEWNRLTESPEVAPAYTQLAAHENVPPSGRLTGVRVASRPVSSEPLARVAQADGDWLIAPELWRTPTNTSPPVESTPLSTEPAGEPSEPASTAAEPPVETTGEPEPTPVAAEPPAQELVELTEPPTPPEPAAPTPDVMAAPAEPAMPESEPTPASTPEPTPAEPIVATPTRDAAVPPTEPEPAPEASPQVPRTTEPTAAAVTPLPTPLPSPPASSATGAGSLGNWGSSGLLAPPPLPTQPTAPSAANSAPPSQPPVMPSPHSAAASATTAATGKDGKPLSSIEAHEQLFATKCYPTARDCATCHEKIYEEWAVSQHAYAYVSPMFHKFEQKITDLSNGTIGSFCTRCHSPAGVALGVPRDMPLWEQPAVAVEGITCIACHRVAHRYTKTNGERRIEPADVYGAVYGTSGGAGLADALARKSELKLKTSPDAQGPGQPIHTEVKYFEQLSESQFCASCHQVAVHPGVKLEVVWEQYRSSPAYTKGITCQDCHMGRVPGIAAGYDECPAAVVNDKPQAARKHSDHIFHGPGYSIAHPGIFPFAKKPSKFTIQQWLEFDWRAGWGTDEFEKAHKAGRVQATFPKCWSNADDRYDARDEIDDSFARMAVKHASRRAVMENSSKVDGPFFAKTPLAGQPLAFEYVVANLNEGHNLPTGSLGAQPQLWANVVLVGPDGRRLWESGYTDSNGDVCDIHSVDVRQGRVPFDSQLFNLQTMFLITGATGTDREFFLPVNLDVDQIGFLRPGTIPISVTNHPPLIRMEGRSLAPLGSKRVKYTVPAQAMCQPGRYRLSFRLRNRTEPMYFMRFCDSTPEMIRTMQERSLDVHAYSVEFEVK